MDITETAVAQPNMAQTLEKTLHDALQLARAEIALAKREALEQARSVARSAIFLVLAVMCVQASITTLGVLLLLMTHGTALGFAVVGGLAAVALVLGVLGIRVITRFQLHTPARLALDGRELAGAVK